MTVVVSWVGSFALALAFCAALASTVVRAGAALRHRTVPRWVGVLPFLAALATVATVEWALLTHDFAIAFVAHNGSLTTPAYYTVTSLWAAHDGSLLLWLLIVSGYLAVVVRRRRGSTELHGWAGAVMSAIVTFFAGLALFTTDVFDVVSPSPADGPGPNPLLADHPAMGIHPPLLYLGLLGMAVPFSYAVAALITGQVGQGWIRTIRRATLSAWILLTAGIVLGAWWSYAVLGWGGYWAWDPVENASLMPWLVATALLHSCMVQRHRRALPAWNLSLAVAAFALACLASFLTRSGVVSSVHSFAESSVGPVLLGLLAALVVGVAVLVMLRPDRLRGPRQVGPPLSRGGALLANNVLLTTITTVVLVGTLYPILVEMTSGRRISVGPPYFDRAALPIALVLLVAMGIGPLMGWRATRPGDLGRRLLAPAGCGLAVVALLAWIAPTGALPLLTFGAAAFVVAGVVQDTWRRVRGSASVGPVEWVRRNGRRSAGLLVHVGLAVAAIGIAGSSAYGSVTSRTLHPGDTARFAGHTVSLLGVHRSSHDGTMQTTARLRLRDGGTTRVIEPGLRYYRAQDTTVALPAVVSRIQGDFYVTLLAVQGRTAPGQGAATLRVAVNPLVGWIWAGGAVMVAGGLLAAGLRRRSPARLSESRLPAPTPEPEPALEDLVAPEPAMTRSRR